jgi:hypothetical protein
MLVRSHAIESFRGKSAAAMRAALESHSTDLVAVAAATPSSNREALIQEIVQVIRSQVKTVDGLANNHFHSRPTPAGPAAAATRRPARKTRVGLEDLEDRVIPSVMTITVTNHPSAQVQRIA